MSITTVPELDVSESTRAADDRPSIMARVADFAELTGPGSREA